jgi:hypothetical protein
MKKSKKHQEIIKNYDKIKSKHLEKIATKMLKDKDKEDLLKTKDIKGDFLNLF